MQVLLLCFFCFTNFSYVKAHFIKEKFIFPYIESTQTHNNSFNYPIVINLDEDWRLELNINKNLEIAPNFIVEQWAKDQRNQLNFPLVNCQNLIGKLRDNLSKCDNGTVFITLCSNVQITGLIQCNTGTIYVIEPTNRDFEGKRHRIYVPLTARFFSSRELLKQNGTEEQHALVRLTRAASESSLNLTDDVIEIRNDTEKEENVNLFNYESSNIEPTPLKNVSKWRKEDLENEELGYFFDTAWETTRKFTVKDRTKLFQATTPTENEEKWLEIAVIADYSVIEFHGQSRVRQYVIALMNIVASIYKDSSLATNLHLVMTRLILHETKSGSQIREGNAKRSLENVNRWNHKYIQSLPLNESHHDVAVWLTRLDIGGPSGYAPVSGTCDPARSCALNRDEGLTSAFIIAHEMAHILGLSHDGDLKSGNNCGDEALAGSIMAPLVSATFLLFTWSRCSQKEFQHRIQQWSCLRKSPSSNETIYLDSEIQSSYSMDEQCRMEFGNGYKHCKSFDIVEPCSHLWCGHSSSSLMCKTKKGPPLEGTECGYEKSCVSGYCQYADVGKFRRYPVMHNPRNGNWSKWSAWGGCSTSCGTGVAFRSRKCNNPSPAYGGANCKGNAEQFRVCNTRKCKDTIRDFRTMQCSRLKKIIVFENPEHINMTWLPYESENDTLKCRLGCISRENSTIFMTEENLIDGTRCSYDTPNGICVQGKCHKIGCDGFLYSNKREDSCGVCNGNGTHCRNFSISTQKTIKRDLTQLVIIPRLARNIFVETHLISAGDLRITSPLITFSLKDRGKHYYNITTPNSRIQETFIIVEGTRFHYKRRHNVLTLQGRGPLLSDIMLYILTPVDQISIKSLEVSVQSVFTQHKRDVSTNSRYRWVEGGWGPCSTSCGGGYRHRTIACRDITLERIVSRRHCSVIVKPPIQVQPCNNISCSFVWKTGDWEYCTATCGSRGIQTRQLFCIHQPETISVMNNVTLKSLSKALVPLDQCSPAGRPEEIRSCNRFPCLVNWVQGNWSRCSTSCGIGFSTREIHCPVLLGEPLFTCGAPPAHQTKSCRAVVKNKAHFCPRATTPMNCFQDASSYCKHLINELLGRYCVVPAFRRICCKSCSQNDLPPYFVRK